MSAAGGRRRADVALVERGLVESRARAQAVILAGLVFSGERRVDKAGALVADDQPLELRGREHPWVSRGGLKLAHALDHFAIDPSGMAAIDVGASTGGFTDVLLQRGATRVYAVDVGRGQLAESLRADPRVISMERTNARSLTAATVPDRVAFATADVSFISLALVLAPIASTFGPAGGPIVALVKPQFEAGRAHVKNGIVRDPAVHARVCAEIADLVRALGWRVLGVEPSPIEGGDGNREFLLGAVRAEAS